MDLPWLLLVLAVPVDSLRLHDDFFPVFPGVDPVVGVDVVLEPSAKNPPLLNI